MSKDQPPETHLFTQIDVSTGTGSPENNNKNMMNELCYLMREMISAQDRQNELLEEMVQQFSAAQRQRSAELASWKQANPKLAKNCRYAAELLSKVQTEYLETITEEIDESYAYMQEGEFMVNEFVDRFGPRVAHMNGILQILSQLGNAPDSPAPPKAR